MSDKLKPCPFCGAKSFSKSSDHDGYLSIRCRCCASASAPFQELQNINWNSRPIEDALSARIEELEAWQKEAAELMKKEIKYKGYTFNLLIKQAK